MVDVDDFIQEILVEMEAEKIECTGKVVFSLIMGVICLALNCPLCQGHFELV